MVGGNISKRKGLLSEIDSPKLDYIADRISSNIENGIEIHSTATILDHPDGSVTREKLSGDVIGEIERKADAASTLDGYGIKDAYTKGDVDVLLEKKASTEELSSAIDGVNTAIDDVCAIAKSAVSKALDGKVDKVEGMGLSAVSDVDILLVSSGYDVNNPQPMEYWNKIAVTKSDGKFGLELYDRSQINEKLAVKANKSDIPTALSKLDDDVGYALRQNLLIEQERINKIKYYGKPDIEISPEEWFRFSDDEHTILCGFAEGYEDKTDIVIPYSASFIHDSAFRGCSSLESVTIPNSVISIDFDAFRECSSLTSIIIPSSVPAIDTGTFKDCVSLTSVTIQGYDTGFCDDTFSGCPNLTIHCSQGSCADVYAKEYGINVVYTDIQASSVNPAVKTVIDDVITVNTIYDLGEQTNLSIVLPAGKLGDFIEVDFLSGDVATTLTITSSAGMSEYDLTPESNTIYSLYFNWIRLDADSYGWGFGYAEYTRVVE